MLKVPDLLEPLPVGEKMDQLSILNELIEQRREEVELLKQELTNLSARITSERSQWSQQRADQEHELTLKLQHLEDKYAQKLREAEEATFQAEQSLRVQKEMEREAERQLITITQKERVLTDLSKERLEIEFLRRQVEERSTEVESRWSVSQDMLNKGQDAYSRSEKMIQDVEARNLRMNDLEYETRQREERVLLKEKQVELATQELDRKLEEFKTMSVAISARNSTIGNGDPKPPVTPEPSPEPSPTIPIPTEEPAHE